MAVFKKNPPDYLLHPFLEFLIVTLSLVAILVPLRILSKVIFDDEWIGSIGVITVVFGVILFLSMKEKLGNFGQMFLRQITKNHTRKQKWIIFSQTGLFLSLGILTIFSIHAGNTEYHLLKEQVIAEFGNKGIMIDSDLNFDAINQISSQVSPEQQVGAIAALPLLTIQNFEIFSVVLAVTDQMMGGWVMYFWQIMVIETMEISIFLFITRKFTLKYA
ncbi:hypothetical protein NZNM25_07310 [Nitrosopumilus zosterae]|uniref:Uncharacterized protein n=1 Tax=Nitrosopumilus zosterae TaxID=718286 RepID=A0A2S2KQH9_9ARCH|nr:hypothetical protein [Nitrosopumilus zosterae]BDQ30626.1 hypothetical protein NZOSNM25_000732 [Nitrosopumilus zosterae]GBH33940.1 hypothetical protein NZNM25_07310 [Nitrosopumilus zosterae]